MLKSRAKELLSAPLLLRVLGRIEAEGL